MLKTLRWRRLFLPPAKYITVVEITNSNKYRHSSLKGYGSKAHRTISFASCYYTVLGNPLKLYVKGMSTSAVSRLYLVGKATFVKQTKVKFLLFAKKRFLR